ncbi:MAG: UDP-N-acetylmuramate dehydrogenase [Candidatus Moranbacteria bacterium]|nr:UDP-N-acetylmuramate dehydrogenase [Candidatus Moranbacteria bacterium]
MLDIKRDIILAPYTTFRIGGPAKFFVEVVSEDEVIEALKYAEDNNLRFFVLGGGSNVIVSDNGFDGLVIRLISSNNYVTENSSIVSWAGESLSSVVNFARDNGLGGLECINGIPGTLGGAVRGNAGAYDINEIGIGSMVESVRALEPKNNPKIVEYTKADCEFDYRTSVFKGNPELIIISVKLALYKKDREAVDAKMKEITQTRIVEKPKGWVGSTGSFYKNPKVTDLKLVDIFEKDTGRKAVEGNVIPAFWVISEAGLKGKEIGGVKVSEKNANFIINTGTATAEDVVMLASFVKQQVRDKFGIQLQEEIQYVGF